MSEKSHTIHIDKRWKNVLARFWLGVRNPESTGCMGRLFGEKNKIKLEAEGEKVEKEKGIMPSLKLHIVWKKGTKASLMKLKNRVYKGRYRIRVDKALEETIGVPLPESPIEFALMGGYSPKKAVFLFFCGMKDYSEIEAFGSSISDLLEDRKWLLDQIKQAKIKFKLKRDILVLDNYSFSRINLKSFFRSKFSSLSPAIGPLAFVLAEWILHGVTESFWLYSMVFGLSILVWIMFISLWYQTRKGGYVTEIYSK